VFAFALVAVACGTGAVPAAAGNPDVVDLVADFAFSEARLNGTLPDLDAISADELRNRGFMRREENLLGIGEASWAEFYSYSPARRELTFEFDPSGWYRRLDARVEVDLNGTALTTMNRRDMQEAQIIALPAEYMVNGANRITFRYGHGPAAEAPAAAETDRPRGVIEQLALDAPVPANVASLREDGGATILQLPVGARQEYFADLPAGATLDLGGLDAFGETGAVLHVEFAQDGTAPHVITLDPAQADVAHTAIELAPGPTRIALTAVAAGRAVERGILIGDARVTAPAPALSATLAPAVAATPNVVIYLIDTLRADHLGLYGYDRPTSPNLDRFAEDAIVFESMQAQSSWTKPVVASIMTGLLPQQHGVQGREDNLAADARTIASILRLAGFATHAISTNSTVFSDFNFDVGFHVFDELGERPTDEVHQLSDAVNERFFGWLEGRPMDRPFFAFLHTTDPHEPYVPRQPYRDLLAADVLNPTITKGPSARRALEADPTLDRDRLRRDMEHLYDAEIAFNDAQFGVLVERLKADGLYDSSLIIVLSDHGDEFLEHGAWSHGGTLFQELLHVPLIVKLPDQQRGGERVAERAQHVDVFPTVMQVAGLDYTVDGPGTSLLVLDQSPGVNRPVISHLALTPTLQESVLSDSLKLIRRAPPGAQIRSFLFDLQADPGEVAPISRSIAEGYLTGLLKRAALSGVAGSGGQLILDPEMTEQLRALGYIQN
jgi:arylsulfatase A-like enzyme